MIIDNASLDTDRAGRVHFTDERVRQLAQARYRLATGKTYTQWLVLGPDDPAALIGEARDWLRATVAVGLLPLKDEDGSLGPAEDAAVTYLRRFLGLSDELPDGTAQTAPVEIGPLRVVLAELGRQRARVARLAETLRDVHEHRQQLQEQLDAGTGAGQ